MKHFLLSLITLFTLSAQAQTQPPTMAKLIQLYVDSNMAAINDYAHLLGFKGEPFSYNAVGNTYDYHHYVFSYTDSLKKPVNSLGYVWGQHGIHLPYSLTNISYSTKNLATFKTLVDEIIALGATDKKIPGGGVEGTHYYEYGKINISTIIDTSRPDTYYSIHIGSNRW